MSTLNNLSCQQASNNAMPTDFQLARLIGALRPGQLFLDLHYDSVPIPSSFRLPLSIRPPLAVMHRDMSQSGTASTTRPCRPASLCNSTIPIVQGFYAKSRTSIATNPQKLSAAMPGWPDQNYSKRHRVLLSACYCLSSNIRPHISCCSARCHLALAPIKPNFDSHKALPDMS